MKTYLCYFEIHVDDRTFYEHVLVEADNPDEAIGQLQSEKGDHYHRQIKGCCGEFTEELAKKYMVVKKPKSIDGRMDCGHYPIDGRMDCGHYPSDLVWDDDIKKKVCSSCKAEAYAASSLRRLIRTQEKNGRQP